MSSKNSKIRHKSILTCQRIGLHVDQCLRPQCHNQDGSQYSLLGIKGIKIAWGLSLPGGFQNRHMIHFLGAKHIGPMLATQSHTSVRET